jgi:lysophospholipid acyltransferase (LPLAT)-like uncharacterized protein
MTGQPESAPQGDPSGSPRRRGAPAFGTRRWRRAKIKAIQSSDFFLSAAALVVTGLMSVIHAFNRDVSPATDFDSRIGEEGPLIVAMWHGRHFMTPFVWPRNHPLDALISRSSDAEINARCVSRFGIGTIRGSGGRDRRQVVGRGGARALLEMKRALEKGRNVAMIADISHHAAKEAGEGIVTLARISGRPIVPFAYATSRRHVFTRSWDQAHLNLPFGKRASVAGAPIYVNADDDLETARQRITAALQAVTDEADRLVGITPSTGSGRGDAA